MRRPQKFRANLLDRAIAILAPKAGFERLRARTAFEAMRAYEGATKGRRGDRWKKVGGGMSADSQLLPALEILRERSHHMVANNEWATKAQSVVCSHTVGPGILPRLSSANGRPIPAQRKRRITAAIRKAITSTEIDITGDKTLFGLQEMAMAGVFESGEVLVRRRWRANAECPLQLQVLEPDYLDSTRDTYTLKSGENIVLNGIEYDPDGRKVAYWLLPFHSKDISRAAIGMNQSVRVDASEILHLGACLHRPGASRYAPWLTPCLLTLGDFDDFEDAVLIRQKIANAWAGFIHGDGDEPDPNLVDNIDSEDLEKIESGMIEYLPPGKEITFPTPPSAPDHEPYARSQRLRIAAAIGITYESLSGDLRGTNYSSGRIGRLEMDRNVGRWQQRIMIDQFLSKVAEWLLAALDLKGHDTKNVAVGWTPPPRIIVDPAKEVPALIKRIRAGLTTMPEALRELGRDPTEVAEEAREWFELCDDFGIVFDTDARRVAASGVSSGLVDNKQDGSQVDADDDEDVEE